MAEVFANNFATQLTVGCAPADNVIHVALPAPTALQGGQFRILVDGEYMLVTGGQSTTTWNVTRGAGTGESPTPTAGTHFAGTWVTHLWTAAGIANLSSTLTGAITSVNGETGAVSLASTDLTDSANLERGAAKDQPNGYAGLDATGLLKIAEIPDALGNTYTDAQIQDLKTWVISTFLAPALTFDFQANGTQYFTAPSGLTVIAISQINGTGTATAAIGYKVNGGTVTFPFNMSPGDELAVTVSGLSGTRIAFSLIVAPLGGGAIPAPQPIPPAPDIS